MFSLEQEAIFSRAKHPVHAGNLKNPSRIFDGANTVCGDEVHLEINLNEEGKVIELVHRCRSCAICSAAADLLAEQVVGLTLDEISKIKPETIKDALGIELSPTRLKCALLPIETLKQT